MSQQLEHHPDFITATIIGFCFVLWLMTLPILIPFYIVGRLAVFAGRFNVWEWLMKEKPRVDPDYFH